MMRILNIIFLLIFLTACTSKEDRLFAKLSKGDRKLEQYPGHFKFSQNDNPKPEEKKSKKPEVGIASWYGDHKVRKGFHGKKTANGDKFNTHMLTAAHKTLPIPSIAKITNLDNGKTLIVMINDRGPYTKSRILDVSSEVASILNFKLKGVAKVKIEPLEKETHELLHKLSLEPKHGSKPSGKIKQPKCTPNCHIKLLNHKHGIKLD